MQVITLESEVFQKLVAKLTDIENYVKRTTDLFIELEEHLELTSREIMDTLQVSKSTLYRWRQDRIIPFHYDDSGNVLYSFKGLVLAIKSGQLNLRNTNKSELLTKLADFKETMIQNSLWQQKQTEL